MRRMVHGKLSLWFYLMVMVLSACLWRYTEIRLEIKFPHEMLADLAKKRQV